MTGPEHLIIAPILIPFFAGALMLIYDERQRRAKLAIGLIAIVASLLCSAELLARTQGDALSGNNDIGFYLLGDWAARYGIVLVIDRLSAMMLVLTGLLALPVLIYASANWHRQGQHFHSMLQFLLMGLNGAFLTGDLFNLFVFFEVLLAASYGLMLHGGGQVRVLSGMHYIAVNLTGSLLFLIGVSLIYGATGTLNMSQLSNVFATLPESRRPLLEAGAAIMGLAFLIKAGIWPLSFWLAPAYSAGAPPVAAMFTIMTKVGVYVILRLSFLIFGAEIPAVLFGPALMVAGVATLAFGCIGMLASEGPARMTAYQVLMSSGTVLAAAGFVLAGGEAKMLASALFYLVSSTLATGALFLLTEPMGSAISAEGEPPAVTDAPASRAEVTIPPKAIAPAAATAPVTVAPVTIAPVAMAALGGVEATEADATDTAPAPPPEPPPAAPAPAEAESTEPHGSRTSLPGALNIVALCFAACTIILSGLPPFTGFIGKLGMLEGLFAGARPFSTMSWIFGGLLVVSGFVTLIAMMRLGIRAFWSGESEPPKAITLEMAPILVLIGLVLVLTLKAGVSFDYMRQTADALLRPAVYVEGVLGATRAADEEEAAQ